MTRAILNLIIGALLIGASLSGRMVMRGTASSWPLAALGGVVVALGIYRLFRLQQQRNRPAPEDDED